jgi:hypothetical protein
VGFAARQEDLDRFGGAGHAASASGTRPRTSIWPVTTAEIIAERQAQCSVTLELRNEQSPGPRSCG